MMKIGYILSRSCISFLESLLIITTNCLLIITLHWRYWILNIHLTCHRKTLKRSYNCVWKTYELARNLDFLNAFTFRIELHCVVTPDYNISLRPCGLRLQDLYNALCFSRCWIAVIRTFTPYLFIFKLVILYHLPWIVDYADPPMFDIKRL